MTDSDFDSLCKRLLQALPDNEDVHRLTVYATEVRKQVEATEKARAFTDKALEEAAQLCDGRAEGHEDTLRFLSSMGAEQSASEAAAYAKEARDCAYKIRERKARA